MSDCLKCGEEMRECVMCGEKGCVECETIVRHEASDEYVHAECLDDYKDELKTCPNCNGSGGGDEHWRCPDCRGTGERKPGPDDDDDGDRAYDEMRDRELEETAGDKWDFDA